MTRAHDEKTSIVRKHDELQKGLREKLTASEEEGKRLLSTKYEQV